MATASIETKSFVVNVTRISGSTRQVYLKNVMKRLVSKKEWDQILEEVCPDVLTPDPGEIIITVSTCMNDPSPITVEGTQSVADTLEFDQRIRVVTFTVKERRETSSIMPAKPTILKDANKVLMSGAYEWKDPEQKETSRNTGKDKLFNEVISEMKANGVQFPKMMKPADINRLVLIIVNALWYLDARKQTIQKRALSQPSTMTSIPERFMKKYNGYNDFKKKKQKIPTVDSESLQLHVNCLQELLDKRWIAQWGDFGKDIEYMAVAMSDYVQFLKKSAQNQRDRQALSHPVRQLSEHVFIRHFAPKGVTEKYALIYEILLEKESYNPIVFDEAVHVQEGGFQNRAERQRFLDGFEDIGLPVDQLRYDPGGNGGTVSVFWKVPYIRSQDEMMTKAAQILKSVEGDLPVYHTRQMRRDFAKQVSLIEPNLPKHAIRFIYTELTSDASEDQNPAIMARVCQAILGDDPELVIDLRHLNKGRPDDTFTQFFDVLKRDLEVICAADERRHGVAHMPEYISVPHLIETTASKLPKGTPIPSESTVLFAFVPKNAYACVSKLYKSKVQLKFKVQTRQLRTSHPDDHYCAAIFKYAKTFAVKYRENTTFVCVDDKSKIDFGEPGQYMSSGVRGKKSIVSANSMLGALDHDQQKKGSFTPSVVLDVEIPEDVADSFYRGKVTVCLKDSVFQPSSPQRHGVEMMSLLQSHAIFNPYLIIYADGGPDHRITFGGVRISLAAIFIEQDLDILVAARTAPGHSWANPVERIMSSLNMILENVSLAREERTADFEQALRSCHGMADIRNKARMVNNLKEEWSQSLEPMKQLLEKRIKYVKLKGEPYQVLQPATEEEIKKLEEDAIAKIDPSLTPGKYQKKDLAGKSAYQTWMAQHCKLGNYLAQYRKCSDRNCRTCKPPRSCNSVEGLPPWIPDPMLSDDKKHYQSFENLFGLETTEQDMPSSKVRPLTEVAEDQQGCKNKELIGQNVRTTITCYECQKPRCVYSSHVLGPRDSRALQRLLRKYQYTCGSMLSVEGEDSLHGQVFVRLQLACTSPIEFPYYSTKNPNIGRKDICAHCASPGATKDEKMSALHKTVLPVCGNQVCKDKPVLRRGKQK